MLEPTQTYQGNQTTSTPNAPSDHRTDAASPSLSLTESADQALQSVSTLYNALDTAVAKHVRENPYATLAAAASVGFILGGGMRSPFGQALVRIGVRAFGPPLVSAALHNAVERAQGLTQPR